MAKSRVLEASIPGDEVRGLNLVEWLVDCDRV